jgi:hypothetical protein
MTPDATILSRQYADLLRANGCSECTIDNYVYALKGFTCLPELFARLIAAACRLASPTTASQTPSSLS